MRDVVVVVAAIAELFVKTKNKPGCSFTSTNFIESTRGEQRCAMKVIERSVPGIANFIGLL